MISIYTDGSCDFRSGDGGWAYVVVQDEIKILDKKRGKEKNTTSNRMEILAAIQALKDNPDQNFTIYTDSKYLKNGITRWIHKWQKNNWMRTKKKEVKNKELWKDLYELVKDRNIKWEWVEGHSGNIFNDIADELANYNF